MTDDPYATAFSLIVAAGSAKSKSMEAIDAAREGRFDEARALLKEADNGFREAHGIQFGLIQQEAKGKKVDVNIILVHAQDHLTMALMAKDNAEETICIYEAIADLKNTINQQ